MEKKEIKINDALKGRFELTEKVTAQKFRHSMLGLIDLETVSLPMAIKLSQAGLLEDIEATKKVEKPKEPKKNKDS